VLKLLSHRQFGGKDFLQRDGDTEAFVHGFIHRAHTTFTKLLNDAVTILQQALRQ
jgi:hypothetical protein